MSPTWDSFGVLNLPLFLSHSSDEEHSRRPGDDLIPTVLRHRKAPGVLHSSVGFTPRLNRQSHQAEDFRARRTFKSGQVLFRRNYLLMLFLPSQDKQMIVPIIKINSNNTELG